MNQTDNHFFLSLGKIRLTTAILSLLLSVCAYTFDDIINRDGVMYMEMVEAYLNGGLAAMADIYDWPFFTMLVAWLSEGLSLPAQLSASLLNTLLFAVFTDALLLISAKLLPNIRQVLIAALLIICFFTLNTYRDFIIRDIGYWAFCSLALYQLLRYQEASGLTHALLWQILAGVAFLFRIEAAVLITLMPLTFFSINNVKSSLKKLLPLYSLVIPVALLAIVLTLESNGITAAFDKVENYLAYFNSDVLMSRISNDLALFEDKILSPFSAEYSGLILFSGLFVMLLYKLAADLSIAYLLLLGLTVWQKTKIQHHPYQRLITWFVFINVLILVAFLFRQYFVVSRYCIMTITGIFLLLLPRFTQLIETVWLQRRYAFIALISLLLFASMVDTFHQTNSKTYIKDTAIWASHHLQATDRVLTDDEFINYYIHREKTPVTSTFRRQGLGNYRNFNYVIVVDKRKRPYSFKQHKNIQLELIHQQENQRGNTASVYKVIHVDSKHR